MSVMEIEFNVLKIRILCMLLEQPFSESLTQRIIICYSPFNSLEMTGFKAIYFKESASSTISKTIVLHKHFGNVITTSHHCLGLKDPLQARCKSLRKIAASGIIPLRNLCKYSSLDVAQFSLAMP